MPQSSTNPPPLFAYRLHGILHLLQVPNYRLRDVEGGENKRTCLTKVCIDVLICVMLLDLLDQYECGNNVDNQSNDGDQIRGQPEWDLSDQPAPPRL